jgi:hypothetical protein
VASKKARLEGDDKVAEETGPLFVDLSGQNMSDEDATTVVEGFLTVPRTLILRNNSWAPKLQKRSLERSSTRGVSRQLFKLVPSPFS